MEEQQQKDVAVFRFGVISDFVTRTGMDRGEQERLIAQKCAMTWQIPHSNRSRLARSTVLGWIKAYRESGGRLESLYPSGRKDQGAEPDHRRGNRLTDRSAQVRDARMFPSHPHLPTGKAKAPAPGSGLEREYPLPVPETGGDSPDAGSPSRGSSQI